MQQLTNVKAAGLLLRSLLNKKTGAEARALILTRLEPEDMGRTEYMAILIAAQRLHAAGRPISLEALESEFESRDPLGFVRTVLRSAYKNRRAGPTGREDVEELVEFLIGFRGQR